MRVISNLPVFIISAIFPALLSTSSWSHEETKAEVGVRHVHMMFQLCRTVEPGFESRNASVYEAWLKGNSEIIAKFSNKPWYQEELKEYIRQESRSRYGLPNCTGLIEHLSLASRQPDPSFSSPERTWTTFMSALRQANRKVLETCLIGSAESKWKETFRNLSDEDLRRMGNAIKQMSVDWGDNQMKSAWVTRYDGNVAAVVFVNVYGNWKISEM